jgi:hypothetical protein
MHADRFRRLLDAQGPFISLYFNDSHDTADAGAQLDARLRDIRKNLEDHSVDAGVVESIAAAVRATHPPVGRSGRGLVASATTGAILLDEHLAVPPVSTLIRVSDLPYIVPVVAQGVPHTSSLLVAVDHTGADISLHDGTSAAGTVDGSAHPIHKTQFGGPQGRVQEAIRKNIREVAQRLTQLVDETGADVVFVTGEAPARAELLTELPDRIAAKTVQLHGGGRTAGTDPDEVDREVAQEFARRRQVVISAATERFAAGHGTGLAVEGLGEVTAALRDGAVETLIIGDLGAGTVVADHDQLLLGTDAAAVSALGGSPDRVLPADEALPLLAVATGAALVPAEAGRTLTDGVAAVLRYADTGQR